MHREYGAVASRLAEWSIRSPWVFAVRRLDCVAPLTYLGTTRPARYSVPSIVPVELGWPRCSSTGSVCWSCSFLIGDFSIGRSRCRVVRGMLLKVSISTSMPQLTANCASVSLRPLSSAMLTHEVALHRLPMSAAALLERPESKPATTGFSAARTDWARRCRIDVRAIRPAFVLIRPRTRRGRVASRCPASRKLLAMFSGAATFTGTASVAYRCSPAACSSAVRSGKYRYSVRNEIPADCAICAIDTSSTACVSSCAITASSTRRRICCACRCLNGPAVAFMA